MADLVVVDEPWFWARTGERVQTNDGNPRAAHGETDFVCLLMPSAVPAGFELTATTATETVAGRVCDVVAAIPRKIDPSDSSIPEQRRSAWSAEAATFGFAWISRRRLSCASPSSSTENRPRSPSSFRSPSTNHSSKVYFNR